MVRGEIESHWFGRCCRSSRSGNPSPAVGGHCRLAAGRTAVAGTVAEAGNSCAGHSLGAERRASAETGSRMDLQLGERLSRSRSRWHTRCCEIAAGIQPLHKNIV